jgi:hypothetical protein
MKFTIELDGAERVTAADIDVLEALLQAAKGKHDLGHSTDEPPTVVQEPKATPPARKKAEPEPTSEPTPEPTPEPSDEDERAKVTARAMELLGQGKQSDIKTALTDLGVKRVSELKPNQFAAFLEAVA